MPSPIVSVIEHNGNAVQTDKTSSIIRFKQADDAVVNTTNALVIPGAGRLYSYEKWLRLRIGVGSPAQQLTNLRFYTDGTNSFGSGVSLYAEVSATDTFRSASQPSTNNTPPNGGSGSRTMTNAFLYTAGSTLSLASATQTFSGTSTDIGRFVVLVMQVVPGATAGTLSPETLSFSYDESAIQTTAGHAFAVALDASLSRSGFNRSTTFDGYIGGAGDDGPFTGLAGAESEFFFEDLLANDFAGCSTTPAITAIADAINGSASLGAVSILFTPLASGTAAFHYIVNVADQFDTASVGITVTEFMDTAILLPFYTLSPFNEVVEQRAGHARGTGIDINKQIVSYDSGQERFTIDLSSGVALGLMVEDTGENLLSNSALSGAGTTNPTGWTTIVDGTRSGTASIMGAADGAQAYVMVAASISGGGPGGRPFLQQTFNTLSTSETFICSMTVEYYTGAATGVIMTVAGLGSATSILTPTMQVSAGQITTLPQRLSYTFSNINSAVASTTGTVRYGLGVNSSTSATLIISRPSLEKKKGRLSYTPDAVRNPDMPIVTISHSASATYFPFATGAGSFVIQAKTPAFPPVGSQILLQVDDGTTTNMHQFFRNNSGDIVYKIVTGGLQQARFAGTGIPVDTTFRVEASYNSNDVRYTLNSSQIYTTGAATMPQGVNVMRLGNSELGLQQWNGTIAEVNVFRTPSDSSTLPSSVPTTVPIPDLGPILTSPTLLPISDPGTYTLNAGTDYRIQFTSSGPIMGRVWIIGGRKVHVGWGPTKSDYGGQIVESGDGLSCLIVENMEQECWIEGMYCDKAATHGHCFQVRCTSVAFPVWVLNCYADGALPTNVGGGGSALSVHDGVCPNITTDGFAFRTYGTGISQGGGTFSRLDARHTYGHYGVTTGSGRLIGILYDLSAVLTASFSDVWSKDDAGLISAGALVHGGTPTQNASGNLAFTGAYSGTVTFGSSTNQFITANVGMNYIQPGYVSGGGTTTAPSATSTGTASGGGGSGGGGSDPGNTVPSLYYGVGHQMAGLANTSMTVAGRQQYNRIFINKGGTFQGWKFYNIISAGYSAYQGVAGGAGGQARLRIHANDPNAGTQGTAANVPGTIIFTCATVDMHQLHLDAGGDSKSPRFPVISGSCTLSSSTVYHFVFQNMDSNPGSNYFAQDNINPSNNPDNRIPSNPSLPNLYEEVAYRNTATHTWQQGSLGAEGRRDQTPIYQIRFAEGHFQGVPYMENCLQAEDEGDVPVGGSTQVRQVFMPHQTMTLTQVNIVCQPSSSTIPPLIATTRRQSNGFVMDTTSIPASQAHSLISGGRDWLKSPQNLNSGPIVLSSSVTYTLTLTASSGSWGIAGIRDGSTNSWGSDGGPWSQTIAVTGRCEKSTNGGGSWTGFKLNNVLDSDSVDLMWYYTRTA